MLRNFLRTCRCSSCTLSWGVFGFGENLESCWSLSSLNSPIQLRCSTLWQEGKLQSMNLEVCQIFPSSMLCLGGTRLWNLQLPFERLHLVLQLTDDVRGLSHVLNDSALQVMQPEGRDRKQQWVPFHLRVSTHRLYAMNSPALHVVQLRWHPHTCNTWTRGQSQLFQKGLYSTLPKIFKSPLLATCAILTEWTLVFFKLSHTYRSFREKLLKTVPLRQLTAHVGRGVVSDRKWIRY